MGTAVGVIRPMRGDDIVAVVNLEEAHQPRPWSEAVFRDELSTDGRVYVVAEADSSIVGFGGVMVVGDQAHVTNLLVDHEHRRLGIATDMMVSLIESAIGVGARHLTLEVRAANEPARRLYARFGLAPVGVRNRYYGDDDALIMWAHDIDRPGYLEGVR